MLVRVKPEYSITAPRFGQVGELTSRTGMDLTALRDALDTLGASYSSLVDLTPAQTAELRERARRRSGRWSRDLSDWIAVQCKGDLLSTASYLQGLAMVDLVEIEARVNQAQCPTPPGECSDLFDAECANGPIFPPYADAGCDNCGGLQGGGAIAGCIDLINEWYSTNPGLMPASDPRLRGRHRGLGLGLPDDVQLPVRAAEWSGDVLPDLRQRDRRPAGPG